MAIEADQPRNYSGMFDSNIGNNSRLRTIDTALQTITTRMTLNDWNPWGQGSWLTLLFE
jgi:hypothetical protein